MMIDDWADVDWSLVDFGDEKGAAKAAPVPVSEAPKKRRGRPPKVKPDADAR